MREKMFFQTWWSFPQGKDYRGCSWRLILLSRSHGFIFPSSWQILLGPHQKPYKTTPCSSAWISALRRVEWRLARTAFLRLMLLYCNSVKCPTQRDTNAAFGRILTWWNKSREGPARWLEAESTFPTMKGCKNWVCSHWKRDGWGMT